MDINTLSLTPTTTEEPAAGLLANEQAVALVESRRHVLIDVLIVGWLLLFLWGAGVPERRDLAYRSFVVIGLLAAYDLHGWFWLRRAEPSDAYRRLQASPANADVLRVLAYVVIAIPVFQWLTVLLFAPRP